MKDLNVKDIRKAAFAVGIGFTVGKECGEYISAVLGGILIGVTRGFAKHGNKFAQDVCDGIGIEYEMKDDKEVSNKTEIGFHA